MNITPYTGSPYQAWRSGSPLEHHGIDQPSGNGSDAGRRPVYAPNANVDISGGGNGSGVQVGSIIAGSITGNGGGNSPGSASTSPRRSAPHTDESTVRAHGEAGESLAEIIVTIAIIGLAVVALVGALATGIAASSRPSPARLADTIARSVAEAIKDRTVPLDPNGSYPPSIWTSTVDTTGYNVMVAAKCLNGVDV